MSELRPILGDEPTDDEKRLLGSARLDVPPQAGRRRTLAAMGLAAAVTTTAGTGGAAATTAGAGLMVKWLALGAIGGTIALGAVGSLTPLVRGLGRRPAAVVAPRPARASSSPGRLSFGVPSAPRAAPVEVLPPLPDVEALAPLPEVEAASDPARQPHATPSPARILARRVEASRPADLPASLAPVPPDVAVAPAVPSAPAADDTLTAEVTALDEARRALAAGDPGATLVSLDAYDRRFARRRLGPEAAVLRIEALIAEGRLALARQLGDELLAAEPNGAYAQHVRSILSTASQ